MCTPNFTHGVQSKQCAQLRVVSTCKSLCDAVVKILELCTVIDIVIQKQEAQRLVGDNSSGAAGIVT